MKKLILVLIIACSVTFSFGQQLEKLDYCNCQDMIGQTAPVLNGKFERKCNGILIEQGEFINGSKNGEWITYSRKGKLIRKINFENGLLNGKIELYYVNGSPKVTGEFEKGNKINRWTYYADNGKILCDGSYDSNIPIGIWTINDKKGKKPVIQYDFYSNKYLIRIPTLFYKDSEVIQNENTEEWYILRSPELEYHSKSEPLGGYGFANYMFIELVEVPEVFWNTYLYNKYKITFKISAQNDLTFNCQLSPGDLPEVDKEITFLINTNPTSKLNRIKHSDLELKLIKFKIEEAISLMPPWIFNENTEEEVYLHYVINENMHRNSK